MKNSIIRNNYVKIIGIVMWLMIWEAISLAVDNVNVLPSPYQTYKALSLLMFEIKFFKSIAFTLYRVFLGFFISVVSGIALGVVSGLNDWVHDLLNPIIVTVKSTPVISVILIVILWSKSGNAPIIISFLMTFPMIWTNTVQGIKATDKKILEMARSFQVRKTSIIKNIYLPSIRPFVLSGITYAVGISWKVTVAAEVISHPKFGIGSRLYESKIYIAVDEVFAWTFIVILFSFVFEYAIKYWLKKLDKSRGVYSD